MAYTKLDSGICDSTIWQAPDTTRLVWITLLAMADQHGYVGASMPGLAGRARVSLQACIDAIRLLESPDEWSRTKDNEGRRIAEADGGWVLLNHAKYREKQSQDDRRERSRMAMALLRARRKAALAPDNMLAHVNTSDPQLTQAEAEAEAVKVKTSSGPALRAAPAPPPPFDGKNAEALNGKAIVPIAANFDLPELWGVDAEALGWQRREVLYQAEKFRQYWTAGKGQGKRRSVKGWRQSWSTWLDRAAKDQR